MEFSAYQLLRVFTIHVLGKVSLSSFHCFLYKTVSQFLFESTIRSYLVHLISSRLPWGREDQSWGTMPEPSNRQTAGKALCSFAALCFKGARMLLEIKQTEVHLYRPESVLRALWRNSFGFMLDGCMYSFSLFALLKVMFLVSCVSFLYPVPCPSCMKLD